MVHNGRECDTKKGIAMLLTPRKPEKADQTPTTVAKSASADSTPDADRRYRKKRDKRDTLTLHAATLTTDKTGETPSCPILQ